MDGTYLSPDQATYMAGNPATTKSQSRTVVTSRDVTALVLGIVGLYLAISGSLPVVGYLFSLVLGIIGAVQANRARKDLAAHSVALSTAGMVCSVIAIVVSLIMIIAIIALVGVTGLVIGEAASEVFAGLQS